MRVLVTSLFKALPMMADVLALFAFIFLLFGIVGMQLFGGRLQQVDNLCDRLVFLLTRVPEMLQRYHEHLR